jgi:hypothetical protein
MGPRALVPRSECYCSSIFGQRCSCETLPAAGLHTYLIYCVPLPRFLVPLPHHHPPLCAPFSFFQFSRSTSLRSLVALYPLLFALPSGLNTPQSFVGTYIRTDTTYQQADGRTATMKLVGMNLQALVALIAIVTTLPDVGAFFRMPCSGPLVMER